MNIEEGDLIYEEDLIRNPYSVKIWIRYIDHKKACKPRILCSVYERAVNQLPYSYKLWFNYLKVLRFYCTKLTPYNTIYEETNNTYERALTTMHKMPRIWIDYLTFLKEQMFTTRFRRTLNRCLVSLPPTQHKRVWKVVFEFMDIHKDTNQELCLRLFRHYMELAPEDTEEFIKFLLQLKRYDEASIKLVEILNNEKFGSKYNKSKFELWMELCEIITKNPSEIHSVKVDAIIRQGISRYKDQVGLLWCALADYYIRSKNFEHAKDIYEEAMVSIETIADFKQVFQAYSDFYKEIIKKKIELWKERSDDLNLELEFDMDYSRAEYLTERRALLLNSVMLKQNPLNIENWLERVKLLEDHGIEEQIKTIEEAIAIVGLKNNTIGRISQLWINMANIYIKSEQINEARNVYIKASQQDFGKVEDLADIYCSHAEMEMIQQEPFEALKILRKAVKVPYSKNKISYTNSQLTSSDRVHKSRKIWCFLIDLTVTLCNLEEAKSVYDSMIRLSIATPQIILNYAEFLEERHYFEQSFGVYQKGVSLFKWPVVYDIWLNYITKFVNYYKKEHYERTLELFESCLEHCPMEHCRKFYLLYAKYVEEYGLNKNALAIYERTALAEKLENRYDLFVLYIEKVKQFRGVMQTRSVFELAIKNCRDCDAKKLCLQFCEMEKQLGEIDRARSIYSFCSQFCDPRVTQEEFWDNWTDFELKFGNKDTIATMNQLKRSVEARYNTHQNLVAATSEVITTGDSMQQLDAVMTNGNGTSTSNSLLDGVGLINYVKAGVEGGTREMKGVVTEEINPEAMNIDMSDDDNDEDEEMDDEPVEKPLPKELGISSD